VVCCVAYRRSKTYGYRNKALSGYSAFCISQVNITYQEYCIFTLILRERLPIFYLFIPSTLMTLLSSCPSFSLVFILSLGFISFMVRIVFPDSDSVME
jgi:hypothetical protein